MDRTRKVSIEDVARRAQVSISTVSRVINKFPSVSKKNQARVEEAVAFLHYEPDISAQRLASGRNMAVGLVMPGYPGIFHSFYAIEIIRGVGHACETLHLDMIFHIITGIPLFRYVVKRLLVRWVLKQELYFKKILLFPRSYLLKKAPDGEVRGSHEKNGKLLFGQ